MCNVETQYQNATSRITDGVDEQHLLEIILDITKPPVPADCDGMNFLLSTPFRYTTPHGSRFRKAEQVEGAFYASEESKTAFQVSCAVEHIDLTLAPFIDDASIWEDPVDYAPCQELANRARDVGVQIIRSRSVRDPEGGYKVTVLNPEAFPNKSDPSVRETWNIFLRKGTVEVRREFLGYTREYAWADFGNDPRVSSVG
jgi:hypothetical protein